MGPKGRPAPPPLPSNARIVYQVDGSFSSLQDTEIFCKYRDLSNEKQKSQLLSVLRLRYFTPREVANLLGFPTEFCKYLRFNRNPKLRATECQLPRLSSMMASSLA
mgnify:CR=1 FL=1